MPWSPADAKRHKKGLTPAQSRRWAQVANGALKSTGDDGRAIRIANAAVGKKKGAR